MKAFSSSAVGTERREGQRKALDKNTTFDRCARVLAVICVYPCYLVLVLSLNDPVDALRGRLFFFPRVVTLDNFVFFFKDPSLFRAFYISVARTVIGALTSVFFTACFAYGVSKKYLVGRKAILTYMLITMYINGEV